MMYSGATKPKTHENEVTANNRLVCTLPGCRRVYNDQSALETHIKEHEIPTHSVPDKVLLCSSAGCSGSFPNMQKLMEHMRHHHKLNIFFQCESCRTKLRSYRGLLTHLRSCSKVPRAKPKLPESTLAPPTDPTAMDSQPSQQESAYALQQLPAQVPVPVGSFPNAGPPPESAAPVLLTPSGLSPQETSPQQLAEAPPPTVLVNTISNQPPSDGPKAMPSPPEMQGQKEISFAEPMETGPVSAPHCPVVATWRKKQCMATKKRILWEHTRGRYTCVQCGHIVTNRKKITEHISSHHKGNKAAVDTGNP